MTGHVADCITVFLSLVTMFDTAYCAPFCLTFSFGVMQSWDLGHSHKKAAGVMVILTNSK